jgi:hypothetical protein
MDGYLVKGSVSIPRGSMLRIDDGAGLLLRVWEGEVWVTQEGSSRDHLLRAGQRFRVERDGAAIAHAFQRASVSLSSPTPDIPAQRISLVHPRGAIPEVLRQRAGSRPWQALRKFLAALFAPRPSASVS